MQLEYVAESLYNMSRSEDQSTVTATIMVYEPTDGSVSSLFFLQAGNNREIDDFATGNLNIFSTRVWNDTLYKKVITESAHNEGFPSFLVTSNIPENPDEIKALRSVRDGLKRKFSHPDCMEMSLEVQKSTAIFSLNDIQCEQSLTGYLVCVSDLGLIV